MTQSSGGNDVQLELICEAVYRQALTVEARLTKGVDLVETLRELMTLAGALGPDLAALRRDASVKQARGALEAKLSQMHKALAGLAKTSFFANAKYGTKIRKRCVELRALMSLLVASISIAVAHRTDAAASLAAASAAALASSSAPPSPNRTHRSLVMSPVTESPTSSPLAGRAAVYGAGGDAARQLDLDDASHSHAGHSHAEGREKHVQEVGNHHRQPSGDRGGSERHQDDAEEARLGTQSSEGAVNLIATEPAPLPSRVPPSGGRFFEFARTLLKGQHAHSLAAAHEAKDAVFDALSKAAGHGHAQAQNDLGLMYEHGFPPSERAEERRRRAAALFAAAAADANPDGMFNLGRVTEQGLGTKQVQQLMTFFGLLCSCLFLFPTS